MVYLCQHIMHACTDYVYSLRVGVLAYGHAKCMLFSNADLLLDTIQHCCPSRDSSLCMLQYAAGIMTCRSSDVVVVTFTTCFIVSLEEREVVCLEEAPDKEDISNLKALCL